MIFWILLGIAAFAVVATFIYQCLEWRDFGMLFAITLMAAILSLVAGGILMLILAIWFGPTYQQRGDTTHELVALQTSSSVEGSFFLGSGYVDGKRTLNYITDEDGAYRIESADAVNSVIYQDSTVPTVTVTHWVYENPWFAPFAFGAADTYEFHVPKGSILSDYTIDNQ